MKSIRIDPFEEVLEEVRKGRPIVMVDDADRENEGDLMVAAEKATSEGINFMLREGKGLICISVTKELLKKLEMPVQTQANTSPYGTNFAVSFDLKDSETHGSSASARAKTIVHTVSAEAVASDFIRPGHLFPVGAVQGGVLRRRGQTEGSVDISRIAGLHPSGVICEIMDAKGEMLRGKELEEYCDSFDLKITSVEEIVKYRIENELSIRKVAEFELDDKIALKRNEQLFDLFKELKSSSARVSVFVDDLTKREHFALVVGELTENSPVRVHCEDLFTDVFDELWAEQSFCKPSSLGKLDRALEEILGTKSGVLIYLRQESGGSGLAAQVEALGDSEKTHAVESNRDYRPAAHILADLGLKKVRLLGASKFKKKALESFGIEISD